MAGVTNDESAILKKEWAALARENKINGMCIFQNLFQKHPDYQKLFHFTDATAQAGWAALGASVRLLCHAQSVMKSIGSAVGLSHDDATFEIYMKRIGGEHAKRSVGCPEYQAIFPIIVDQLVLCNGGILHKGLWVKFFTNCAKVLAEGAKNPIDGGPVPTDAAIRAVFNDWDADHDGALSTGELQQVMANLQPNVDATKVAQMVAEADKDNDGLIQFEELLAVIRPSQ